MNRLRRQQGATLDRVPDRPSRRSYPLILFLTGVLGGIWGCGTESPISTLRVESGRFVQKVTAEGTLEARDVVTLSVPAEVKNSVRIAWVAADATVVAEGDVVARFDSGALEDRLASGRSALTSAEYRILEVTSQGEVGEARLTTQFGVSELELELAQRFRTDDETVWSRHEILESQTDEKLAQDRMEHAEEQLVTEERRIGSDLGILGVEKRQAIFEIEEAESGLTALVVRAPHAGLFLRARDWRGEPVEVGQELWRGRPIGEIPAVDTLQAEVSVLEADAGGVTEGLEAEVVIESRPEEVHSARVARVDAIAQPRRRGSPVQYFGVTVELDSTDATAMKPGQRVVATIYLHREESAVAVPRQAVLEVGERTYLYVARGAGFERREVELGVGSRSRVVVTAGLEAGEVIGLEPLALGPRGESAPTEGETPPARGTS